MGDTGGKERRERREKGNAREREREREWDRRGTTNVAPVLYMEHLDFGTRLWTKPTACSVQSIS